MWFRRELLRIMSKQVRCMMSTKPKSHYDSLGITPHSTQNEIKTAYYKLSMVYHPDKNKDEASLKKFRDITEAYEVLGNVKTRKLYDRGLYFRPRIRTNTDLAEDKFHKSRETRSRPPPPQGRTPIYDFDEWAKNHYEDTFKRKMESKKRSEDYRVQRQRDLKDKSVEMMAMIFTFVFLICMVLSHDRDYDTVTIGTLGPLVTPKNPDDIKDSKK